jgi:hypothetical protein
MPFVGRATPEPAAPPVAPEARLQPRAHAPLVLGQADDEEAREDWEERLDDLLADWERQVTPAQRDELIDQIAALVDEGAVAGLATLAVSSGASAALLEAVMVAQASAAGERMVAVAEGQGVSIEAAAVTGALAAALAVAAAAVAALLAAGLATAAGRAALRMWAPGMDGATVAARVRDYLDGLTDAALRTDLGGAIWSAENAGRFATLEQAEDDGKGATYFEAVEEGDTNTCIPCSTINGDRFDTLAEAQAEYPNGGYYLCQGGVRCRGTIEPVWGGS